MFDFVVDHDYVSCNMARSVSTRDIRCKEVDNELKVYSNEERNKIIAQSDIENDVFARAIILMFCSCTRIGEIRALKWEDVDFENKTMYIHREIVRRKDKEGHEIFVCVNHPKSGLKEGNRTQPLSAKAIEDLKAQRRDNPFGEYVFLYKDAPLVSNTINHHLMRICERAGVPYMSSYKIRFWSVTTMYANGMQQTYSVWQVMLPQQQQIIIRGYLDLMILIHLFVMRCLNRYQKRDTTPSKHRMYPRLYPFFAK